jgi:predicted kinase
MQLKMKPILYVLIGIPASGKSSWSAAQLNCFVVSSDAIRKEFYGDESCQVDHNRVFQEVAKRVEKSLNAGQNTILDATNASRKYRKELFPRYAKLARICAVYFATPFEECVLRNSKRDRQVPMEAMIKMYERLEMPNAEEGWDAISIEGDPIQAWIPEIDKYFYSEHEIFGQPIFKDIYNLDQESEHHGLTVSAHCWKAYYNVFGSEYLSERDHRVLCYAALFHDVGKAFTKKWNENKQKYVYYDHHHVSAQKMASILYGVLPADEVWEILVLIDSHMMHFQNPDLGRRLVPKAQLLDLLHEADLNAKH